MTSIQKLHLTILIFTVAVISVVFIGVNISPLLSAFGQLDYGYPPTIEQTIPGESMIEEEDPPLLPEEEQQLMQQQTSLPPQPYPQYPPLWYANNLTTSNSSSSATFL